MNNSPKPYQFTKPVYGRSFYGRESFLEDILSNSNDHILILGSRRSGKTSFLLELQNRLCEKKQNIVFESMQHCINISDFKKFISSEMEEILTARVLKSFDNESDLPNAIKNLDNALKKKDEKLIILCDESEKLVDWSKNDKSTLERLRDVLNRTSNIHFILAASHHIRELHETCNWKTSPFLNTFREEYLPNLDINETTSLVQQRKLEANIYVASHVLKEIQNLTNGNPFLIQVLCYYTYENGTIKEITRSHKNEIYKALGRSHYFAHNLKLLPDDERTIIEKFAYKDTISKDEMIQGYRGTRANLSIRVVLDDLTRCGYLKQKSDFEYSISDYFLSRWVKDEVHCRGHL
jgi:hypothetical protein